jgi:aminocarboxymuconate-semialdehyde decarboxylase
LILKKLKKRPFDYFKGFYGDTALAGARAPTICGISFFGPDHVLFASDCPFDKEKGRGYIRSTIAVMESLDLSQPDKEKICYKNAQPCWLASDQCGEFEASPASLCRTSNSKPH